MTVPGPRVRRNDFGVLEPPEPGEWEPRLSVSVVIPARQCQQTLDLTLAALAAQSYPAHLLEVVVVDDDGTPPLVLPEIAPERTRVIRAAPGGWGIAWAVQCGVEAAEGDVIHRLDADIVPYRTHVESHLRWHHLADYLVVLGTVRFTGAGGGLPAPAEVRAAVAAGAEDGLFDMASSETHDWWERLVDEHDGFRRAPSAMLHRIHVGATASAPAALLRAAGGLDTSLRLAEDTELGYRLTQEGAVFVPDRAARSWHVGRPTAMKRGDEVRRHNRPYIADRVPYRRALRTEAGRQWLVPYVEVVVEVGDAGFEDVRFTVDSALASTLPDVHVTLAGPWRRIRDDERRAPLDDPLIDLRLMRAAYAHDGRVAFTESAADIRTPGPFRLSCPPGWAIGAETLDRLTQHAEEYELGRLRLALEERADGVVTAVFDRTSALARAVRVAKDGEDLDDVVHEVFGLEWLDAETWGVVPGASVRLGRRGNRNTEAALWRRNAERHEAEIERLKAAAAALKEEVRVLRRDGAKAERDASRWREKAEANRREVVRLRRALPRAVLTRAVRRILPPAKPGPGS
ncbi:glycosyltransferase [Microbispora sp. RL4-1S]|uniref:Glycosyltransferase n=1 Tax=Microbispora oryzae TaxID=2806554 RepID=A0A940WGM8_9ACTN|nr:glycosyltransferase [Microbispora oryzae]MBP2705181.1 glycosyltransferase [Microbispora oryzae]